jgi:hypothetical protein
LALPQPTTSFVPAKHVQVDAVRIAPRTVLSGLLPDLEVICPFFFCPRGSWRCPGSGRVLL